MSETRLTGLEEAIAHLTAELEDMSSVVRAQEKEISRLRRHVDLLLAQAAAADQDGSATFSDAPPPHY
ncbi:SlyX family protein [Algicella marina]|uniref:SlyX protein n=1 Tax=Algicella marina TaxID=2683284 RepID=A0A6P1T1U7_9RHOB|nr:SlyX family protein [Algicella marina]QHQ35701.1 SlyX protein [Algicella marina]